MSRRTTNGFIGMDLQVVYSSRREFRPFRTGELLFAADWAARSLTQSFQSASQFYT